MELKNKYFKVGHDGFIALKDYMGTDEDIEQAARVSYGSGTRKTSETRGLLRYLMRHRHTTPFEMGELKLHVRAPIYVYRQWHRHRTWSYNEYSGRYSLMIDSMEKTSDWRSQSKTNKQGSGEEGISWPERLEVSHITSGPEIYLYNREKEAQEFANKVYQERLEFGVAREQARKDMPVSNYSEMYAKTDLKNLLGFLSLRSDSHAQLEIREFSNIMAGIVKELFPLTFEAWYDYSFQAVNFTRLDRMLGGWIDDRLIEQASDSMDLGPWHDKEDEEYAKSIGMSKREIEEYYDKVGFSEKDEEIDSLNFSLDGLEEYPNKSGE